jgi:hypothetical protein
MLSLRSIGITVLILVIGAGLVSAQDLTYSGYIDNLGSSKTYAFEIEAGQSVLITAEATSGDLDTYLTLKDPGGVIVSENDDRRTGEILDSAIGYTASVSGSYSITVSRYEPGDSSGNFVLNLTIGDDSVLDAMQGLFTRVELSGPELTLETEHFLIHYTFEGEDATNEIYVDNVSRTVEEIWRIQIELLGWPIPPSDGTMGGDERYDVYLMDLINGEDGVMGYASPEDNFGDNPNTPNVEEYATSSYLALENDFSENSDPGATDISLMRTTAAHEIHHSIQFGYDLNDVHSWYYEATATWMETITFYKEEDATGYVSYNYDYPEICFGTTNDPSDGLMQYGEWMFIQSLADAHGNEVVPKLWDNIGVYEGFEALEQTLARYGDNLPAALARYRMQNLLRDYDLASEFGATVWMENIIDDYGPWTFTGEGIQELGANYYGFRASPGLYNVSLVRDDGTLQLWAVGITGSEAVEIPLGRGATLSTEGYDQVYLMVFNPTYDEEVNECVYSDYTIDVRPGTGEPAVAMQTWNAANFQPLR